MMSSPTTTKPRWLRMMLTMLAAIASAALIGAAIASMLSIDGPEAASRLENPFDASRLVR